MVAPDEELKQLQERNSLLKKEFASSYNEYQQMLEVYEKTTSGNCINDTEHNLQYLYNKLLLETYPDFLVILDTDMNFVTGTNTAVKYSIGAALQEISGKHFLDLYNYLGEWINTVYEHCLDVYKNNKFVQYEYKTDDIFTKQAIVIQININPALDDNGKYGVIVIMHNMTQLYIARESALDAAYAKNQFLAQMSHQIRTPMNAIKGMSNLLLMTELNNMQREYGQSILNASDSLLTIIDDILDFSKIEQDAMDIIAREYDLTAMLTDITNIINLRATEKNLAFVTDIDPDIPSMLYGDDGRIKQVLLNILTNAVKYTRQGHVKFTINKCGTINHFFIKFTVLDTGIGIKEEDIPALFEAFSQVDIKKNIDIQGTGLGLPIAKKLVELMEGTIEVESVYGQGSKFTITLPQMPSSSIPLAVVRNSISPHVLFYSDDTLYGETYTTMLKKLGVSYVYCQKPEELEQIPIEIYTHMLYVHNSNDIAERIQTLVNVGTIISIKNMRYAFHQRISNEISLYEPVLITSIARNLSDDYINIPTQSSYKDKTIGEFKVNGANILIVDDNAVNLFVAKEILSHYNIKADEAKDGYTALKMAQNKKYDLIFMDHMMPGMDGIETTERIKHLSSDNANTPIIALTANVVDGMTEHFISSGMDDILSKPIDIRQLNRVLLTWLPKQFIIHEQGEKCANFLQVLSKANIGIDVEIGIASFMNDTKLYAFTIRDFSLRVLDTVSKLSTFDFNDKNMNKNDLIDELAKLRFELSKIGAKKLTALANSVLFLVSSDMLEHLIKDWNNMLNELITLAEKLNDLVQKCESGKH